MTKDASNRLVRRVIVERLCMILKLLLLPVMNYLINSRTHSMHIYGKSTLRFFAPSITSTDARGGAGEAAALGLASTAARLRRGATFDGSTFGCSLFSEPGSGAGTALSPPNKPRLS